jgi:hypothetical protein
MSRVYGTFPDVRGAPELARTAHREFAASRVLFVRVWLGTHGRLCGITSPSRLDGEFLINSVLAFREWYDAGLVPMLSPYRRN